MDSFHFGVTEGLVRVLYSRFIEFQSFAKLLPGNSRYDKPIGEPLRFEEFKWFIIPTITR